MADCEKVTKHFVPNNSKDMDDNLQIIKDYLTGWVFARRQNPR